MMSLFIREIRDEWLVLYRLGAGSSSSGLARSNDEVCQRIEHAIQLMRGDEFNIGEIAVAIGGAKVLADASRHSAVSYGRAAEQLQQVELQIV
jgi:hypothetical protein